MALYDGFFDAVQNEDTGEYDRAYSSGDFTNYFAKIIGSGVCVHDNPNSFLVRLEDGKVVVSPGYLFIQGYWCKNDADYAIDLPDTSTYAVVAHLNLGKRMIELEARSVAQAYPDSLVLAIVSPTSAEDTRYNTDICGVIDTAGELSSKVAWAINYIDNEIESKLAQMEQDISAQSAKLDAKIAEVQAVADSIVPPPVGSIKFSASQDVSSEWLRCDGSFVNEQDYPELVAALGKLTPSGDKFQLISDGEIGTQISNGAIYDGRIWVYSYTTKKLYGVDVDGEEAVTEISLTSEDEKFRNFITPSNANPIALSIVPHTSGNGAKLFLSQIISSGTYSTLSSGDTAYENLSNMLLIYQAEFSGAGAALPLAPAFTSINSYGNFNVPIASLKAVPSVVSNAVSGKEVYYCALGQSDDYPSGYKVHYLYWTDGENADISLIQKQYISASTFNFFTAQRVSFSEKSKSQMATLYKNESGTGYAIDSVPFALFSASGSCSSMSQRPQPLPVTIAGADKVIAAFDKNMIPWLSVTDGEGKTIDPGLSLPNTARVFVDAGGYLWGKDIYMIFVGTGVIFSRTLEEEDFGYLDTTSVLGTITQFGYLDYSQDEGTLYLLGQDTTNKVKVAKIVLNTLYDYANDGAWLPMIASDGVPAYIKAYEPGGNAVGDTPIQITVLQPTTQAADLLFNGEILIAGAYTRYVSGGGKFSVGLKRTTASTSDIYAKLNGANAVTLKFDATESSRKFKTADYQNGITLQIAY